MHGKADQGNGVLPPAQPGLCFHNPAPEETTSGSHTGFVCCDGCNQLQVDSGETANSSIAKG